MGYLHQEFPKHTCEEFPFECCGWRGREGMKIILSRIIKNQLWKIFLLMVCGAYEVQNNLFNVQHDVEQ